MPSRSRAKERTMPSDRRATILAILAWLAHLGTGNIVVERWRVELVAELREIIQREG